LWTVEVRGSDLIECYKKVVVREARLVEQVRTWNKKTARLFAADCAERALHLTNTTDERCWVAVDMARLYAWGACSEEDGRAAEAEAAAAWAAWAAEAAAAWAAEAAAAWAAAAAAWAARAARAPEEEEEERRRQTEHLLWYLGIDP
jgi:hypothetical protein